MGISVSSELLYASSSQKYSFTLRWLVLNILVVTKLIPDFREIDSIHATKAIANFVEVWGKETDAEIAVLRPIPVPLKYFWQLFTGNGTYSIGDVKVIQRKYLRSHRTSFCFDRLIMSDCHIRDFQPDVIVVHMFNGLYIAKKILDWKGGKLVFTFHSSDIEKIEYIQKYKPDQMAYRSASIRRILLGETKPGETAFVVDSGIEEKHIVDIEVVEHKDKSLSFISVCRLVPYKNIEKNVEVLASLPVNMDWSYTIVGDGPERQSVLDTVSRLGVSQRVRFTGILNQDEVFRFLDQANFFIMVSAPETFGLAYLEAMARGLIVIGATGWGIDGIIENRRNGFLCHPYDPQEVRQTLVDLRSMDLDTIRRESMQTIREFTAQKKSLEYYRFLERVVDGSMATE